MNNKSWSSIPRYIKIKIIIYSLKTTKIGTLLVLFKILHNGLALSERATTMWMTTTKVQSHIYTVVLKFLFKEC